ncbi:MAG TPA: hypothetical protein VLC93_10905, partial [Myxococcota bacterium]|nr:hypothetical protein [Myxococcota bacterium]
GCLTPLTDQGRLDQPRRKRSDIVDNPGRRDDEATLIAGGGGARFGVETSESTGAPGRCAADLLFWIDDVSKGQPHALELRDPA